MEDQLKRLEAITNRLESVANKLSPSGTSGQSKSDDNSEDIVNSSPVLRDYETLINESVKPFLATSQKIGAELTTLSDHVKRLFEAQQQFLRRAVQSTKPNDQDIIAAIKPQSSEIEAITSMI